MGVAVFAVLAVGWLAFLAMLYVVYGRRAFVAAASASVVAVALVSTQLSVIFL